MRIKARKTHMLICIMMAFMISSVCASDYHYEYDESDMTKQEIETFINEKLDLYQDQDLMPIEYDLNEAYYTTPTNAVIISSYAKKHDVEDIKSDDIPSRVAVNYKNRDGNSCCMELAKNEDGEIYLLGIKKSVAGDETKNNFFSPFDAEETIENFNGEIDKIEYLSCARYYMMLVRICSNNEDYIIAYNLGQEDIPGVEYEQIKKADAFFDNLSSIIDEEYMIAHPDENGGLVLKDKSRNVIIYIAIIVVIGICVSVTLIFRKRITETKKQNKTFS